MDVESLAFQLGYAFCQAVNVQTVLEEDALMVPFVVHWNEGNPKAIMYPASTQQEAVDLAIAARDKTARAHKDWSSGRDGLVQLNSGEKHDVLFIEASVPGLREPQVLLYLYKTKPFALVDNFIFQNHQQVRRTLSESKEFMVHFKRGLLSHPFGSQCLLAVESHATLA